MLGYGALFIFLCYVYEGVEDLDDFVCDCDGVWYWYGVG